VHMVVHPLIQTSGILSHPLSCTSLSQSLILEAPVDCSLSCSSSRGETRAPSGVAAHKYLWIMIFIQYNSHNFCIKLMVTQKGKHRISCISLSTLLTLDHKSTNTVPMFHFVQSNVHQIFLCSVYFMPTIFSRQLFLILYHFCSVQFMCQEIATTNESHSSTVRLQQSNHWVTLQPLKCPTQNTNRKDDTIYISIMLMYVP
jgi:hypothetical protein